VRAREAREWTRIFLVPRLAVLADQLGNSTYFLGTKVLHVAAVSQPPRSPPLQFSAADLSVACLVADCERELPFLPALLPPNLSCHYERMRKLAEVERVLGEHAKEEQDEEEM